MKISFLDQLYYHEPYRPCPLLLKSRECLRTAYGLIRNKNIASIISRFITRYIPKMMDIDISFDTYSPVLNAIS